MQAYKTTANQVRTGHVIALPQNGYRTTLEVEIVHIESFTSPEDGITRTVYRFTGWRNGSERITRGAGQFPTGRVLVVGDLRGHGFAPTYGALTGAPPVDTQL